MQIDRDKASEQDASPSVSDALAGWRAWAEMLQTYRSMLGGSATGSGDDTGLPGPERGPAADLWQDRALPAFMSQACLVFATSGLRYWTRAAQIYGEYCPVLGQLLSATNSRSLDSTEEQRILLDRLRALLRELAELPGQESQWMQAELAKLEGQMLSGANGMAGDYTRRWRYKR